MRPGIKLGSCGDTELGVLFSNCVVILTHEGKVVFDGDDDEEEEEGDDFQIVPTDFGGRGARSEKQF